MNNCCTYYQNNAQHYFNETLTLDLSKNCNKFLSHLPSHAHILDLGCGSGRDSLYFKQHGYIVTALDGSEKLAQLATMLINQYVIVTRYESLCYHEQFEAIWACASLLHCSKNKISTVIQRIIRALKPRGVCYMSFKYGTDETIDSKGRFFNNYTATTLQQLIQDFETLTILDIWTESHPLRGKQQQWVNALVQKRNNFG